jgi:hypothetical protein
MFSVDTISIGTSLRTVTSNDSTVSRLPEILIPLGTSTALTPGVRMRIGEVIAANQSGFGEA